MLWAPVLVNSMRILMQVIQNKPGMVYYYGNKLVSNVPDKLIRRLLIFWPLLHFPPVFLNNALNQPGPAFVLIKLNKLLVIN
jgi:hypothetical protein